MSYLYVLVVSCPFFPLILIELFEWLERQPGSRPCRSSMPGQPRFLLFHHTIWHWHLHLFDHPTIHGLSGSCLDRLGYTPRCEYAWSFYWALSTVLVAFPAHLFLELHHGTSAPAHQAWSTALASTPVVVEPGPVSRPGGDRNVKVHAPRSLFLSLMRCSFVSFSPSVFSPHAFS